jgi:hypothetical protein
LGDNKLGRRKASAPGTRDRLPRVPQAHWTDDLTSTHATTARPIPFGSFLRAFLFPPTYFWPDRA